MGNMRYKAGDCVRIKSLDWYYRYTNGTEVDCGAYPFTSDMKEFCGQERIIANVCQECYVLLDIDDRFVWTDEMIEGLVGEEIIDLTSIVMETVEEKTIQNTLTYGYNLPEGYQFVDENGNVINATKIVLEKKKKEYPKTYEECREILKEQADVTYGYKKGVLHSFQKLLICRDAYWKIAGEEMGLGKPWEPDWTNLEYDKFCIWVDVGDITFRSGFRCQHTLAFPTAEMRDAFYENFKEEIEICKELL